MDKIKRAMLGDKKAQRDISDKGELLPCPICNSDNIDTNQSKQLKYVIVRCRKCGYEISAFDDIRYKRMQEMKEAVFKKWNTRPQILTAEELERLEGLE